MTGAGLPRLPKNKMADNRISASEAEYMELIGARKDGDCSKVKVSGGISKERGCCDDFKPETRMTTQFRCGTCRFVTGKQAQ